MTTYNEEKSIENIIKSINNQTEKPNEVIIVDSASRDKTIERAKKLFKKYKIKNKIIIKKCDRGTGRNLAIKNASNEYILGSDAGSILDKNWVKEMKKALNKYDFVLGNFKPTYSNFFEECVSIITYPKLNEEKKLTNASSRSIAFKKRFWKIAKGYPENNTSAEDTEFNFRMKDAGAKIGEAKKAIVYWKVRSTIKSYFQMYYSYGKGDRKNIKRIPKYFLFSVFFVTLQIIILSMIFLNHTILLILIFGLVIYCLRCGISAFNKTKKIKAIFLGTYLFYLKRLAYSLGLIVGA